MAHDEIRFGVRECPPPRPNGNGRGVRALAAIGVAVATSVGVAWVLHQDQKRDLDSLEARILQLERAAR